MTKRPTLFCLAALAALTLSAGADEPDGAAEIARLKDRAKSLRSQATTIKSAAEGARPVDERNCHQKFLVSDCLDKVRREFNDRMADVRKLESEAGRIERDVTNRERIQRGRDAEHRDAEARVQAEKAREEHRQQLKEIEARNAEHQRKLAEGQQRAEEETAKRAQKDAEIARRQQEKAAKAAQEAEKTRKKKADLDAKAAKPPRKPAETPTTGLK